MTARKPTIELVLTSRSTSFWLINALRSALSRDCVDAAKDARLLARLLDERASNLVDAIDALDTGEQRMQPVDH